MEVCIARSTAQYYLLRPSTSRAGLQGVAYISCTVRCMQCNIPYSVRAKLHLQPASIYGVRAANPIQDRIGLQGQPGEKARQPPTQARYRGRGCTCMYSTLRTVLVLYMTGTCGPLHGANVWQVLRCNGTYRSSHGRYPMVDDFPCISRLHRSAPLISKFAPSLSPWPQGPASHVVEWHFASALSRRFKDRSLQ